MPRFLCLTIDTEADHQWAPYWVKSDPLAFRSVLEGITDRLTPLFTRYGAKATYLLTTEVLESEECCRVLGALGDPHELGTHLHPEYICPEREHAVYAGTRAGKYLSSYDPEIQFQKIDAITRLFNERMRESPASFRAGSFGADDTTLRCLDALGYQVDSSVIPLTRWINRYGQEIDFREKSHQPYYPLRGEAKVGKHSTQILEVPVTIAYRTPRMARIGLEFQKKGLHQLVQRVGRRLARTIWLRPSWTGVEDMLWILRSLQSQNGSGHQVINMMFHSMEIVPGASPFAQTEEDCQRILGRIEAVLQYAAESGVQFVTLKELSEYYDDNHTFNSPGVEERKW